MSSSPWKFSIHSEDVSESRLLGVRPSLLRKIIAQCGGETEMEFTLTCDVYNDIVEPVVASRNIGSKRRWPSFCHYLQSEGDDEEDVGLSSVYVSHSWHSTDFLSLVRAIEHHHRHHSSSSDVYYYIDVFSRDCSFDLPLNVQEEVIRRCPTFVMAASPVGNIPVPLTRLHCLLELYMAMHSFPLVKSIAMAMTKEVSIRSPKLCT